MKEFEKYYFIQKYQFTNSEVAQLFLKAKLSISLTGGTANLVESV